MSCFTLSSLLRYACALTPDKQLPWKEYAATFIYAHPEPCLPSFPPPIFLTIVKITCFVETDMGSNMTPDAEDGPVMNSKPTIIGIYGISGCSKSYLLKALKSTLDVGDVLFFEGAEEIASFFDGDIRQFGSLPESDKRTYRERAIEKIQATCSGTGAVGIVAGHYMLYDHTSQTHVTVGTPQDFQFFTHMVYLKGDTFTIQHQRKNDTKRQRPFVDTEKLLDWRNAECSELRQQCYKAKIPFIALPQAILQHSEKVSAVIERQLQYNKQNNDRKVLQVLDDSIAPNTKSVIIFDGDKTLSESDTGQLYLQAASELPDSPKRIFDSYGYTYNAFIQTALFYSQNIESFFKAKCQEVARTVTLYPQIAAILNRAASEPHTTVVVATCGLQYVWEEVLRLNNLSNILVLGNGQLDNVVVDPNTKAMIADHLKHRGIHVTAFGDSKLDIPMLEAAHTAIVVVGSEGTRSTKMERALGDAIYDGSLAKARQALMGPFTPCLQQPLLPDAKFENGVSLANTNNMLPVVDITSHSFLSELFRHSNTSTSQSVEAPSSPTVATTSPDSVDIKEPLSAPPTMATALLRVFDATATPASQILSTSLRNANLPGPSLRAAHQAAGHHLTLTYLPQIVGIETYNIPHVQNKLTDGHRIKDESSTLIVAIMRGGEPMAFGVSEALPLAGFVHAKKVQDINAELLQTASVIVLVDSVVNSGESVIEFLDGLLLSGGGVDDRGEKSIKVKAGCKIVMVTGVVQSEAIAKLEDHLRGFGATQACTGDDRDDRKARVSLVALRKSENSYKGKGSTDTGHRLFGTTQLD